jgi:Lar family restriction alleviation protein
MLTIKPCQECKEPTETALLPCPFCGYIGITIKETEDRYEDAVWYLECDSCGAESGWRDSKKDAIAIWNSRIETSEKCKTSSRSRMEELEWIEGVALAEVYALQEKISVLECAMRHRNLGGRVQKLKLDLDMQLGVWKEVLKTTEFAHNV